MSLIDIANLLNLYEIVRVDVTSQAKQKSQAHGSQQKRGSGVSHPTKMHTSLRGFWDCQDVLNRFPPKTFWKQTNSIRTIFLISICSIKI